MSDRGAPATADCRKGWRCDAKNGGPSISYGRIARLHGRLVVSHATSKTRSDDRKPQHMLDIKIKSSPRYHLS